MAPPVELFHANPSLPYQAQVSLKGNKRKDFDGDLKKCELLEMLQYDCEVDQPDKRNSPVRCWPLERFFRRCRDREGTFMVETTSWEGEKEKKSARLKGRSTE
ncbi:Uncharacterized protein BP5553_03424 [Venustampulla echinocandica]|uniref:Mitochondrial export protein Som1 n=1 Tax=Venustampulla echinocandica TaxID=2656787 RepID=A0A370TU88_9HELO|nr:Uncharacterized protein BP5553_03424 [Venustampulla echinocandica]RDL39084.1 Uncharacterized protein BP5553_03424 [Venustampulla echinocandica]